MGPHAPELAAAAAIAIAAAATLRNAAHKRHGKSHHTHTTHTAHQTDKPPPITTPDERAHNHATPPNTANAALTTTSDHKSFDSSRPPSVDSSSYGSRPPSIGRDSSFGRDSFVSTVLKVRARSSSSMLSKDSWGVPIVAISDAGQDLDDEMAFIFARHLVHRRLVHVRGIVSTLAPSLERGLLLRGTLDMLGLQQVPVGVGTDGGDYSHSAARFTDSYVPPAFSEGALSLVSGLRLMLEQMQQVDAQVGSKKLVFVVIASLKDVAILLRDHEELFCRTVEEVVIMGGVEPFDASDSDAEIVMVPDTAHNNSFDKAASAFFYRRCQELGVRLVVVTRYAAYAAKVPRIVYDELAELGSPIAWRLRAQQRSAIESLWSRAVSEGEARLGLPARCDRKWFLSTFCAGGDGQVRGQSRQADDPIWDLVDGFMQYDTIALLAAVPELRRRYFKAQVVRGLHGVSHLVVGASQDVHGVVQPGVLRRYLHEGYIEGIKCDLRSHRAQHVIVMCQTNWHNLVDFKLFCISLRTLWGIGVVECLGVLVSYLGSTGTDGNGGGNAQNILSLADEMCIILRELGIGHVPVWPIQTDGSDKRPIGVEGAAKLPSAHLKGASTNAVHGEDVVLRPLLAAVPATGVSIVALGGLKSLASFCVGHPQLFREKTTRIVHVGGALREMGSLLQKKKSESGLQSSMTLWRQQLSRMMITRGGVEPLARLPSSDRVEDDLSDGDREGFIRASSLELGRARSTSSASSASGAPGESKSPHGSKSPAGSKSPHWQSVLGKSLVLESSMPVLGKTEGKGFPSVAETLKPDPEASNNMVDLDSAEMVYGFAQSFSIPLVIISRHVAHTSRIPHAAFDHLAKWGGKLGKALVDAQREELQLLWRLVRLPAGHPDRAHLPSRCDEPWFRDNFRVHTDGEDLSDECAQVISAQVISIYAPIALLATFPKAIERLFDTTTLKVRSASHKLVNAHSDQSKCCLLQKTALHCLFRGVRLNAAEFDLGTPEPFDLSLTCCKDGGGDVIWKYESDDKTLRDVLVHTETEGAAGSP